MIKTVFICLLLLVNLVGSNLRYMLIVVCVASVQANGPVGLIYQLSLSLYIYLSTSISVTIVYLYLQIYL